MENGECGMGKSTGRPTNCYRAFTTFIKFDVRAELFKIRYIRVSLDRRASFSCFGSMWQNEIKKQLRRLPPFNLLLHIRGGKYRLFSLYEILAARKVTILPAYIHTHNLRGCPPQPTFNENKQFCDKEHTPVFIFVHKPCQTIAVFSPKLS